MGLTYLSGRARGGQCDRSQPRSELRSGEDYGCVAPVESLCSLLGFIPSMKWAK
jgi:hypothetical protein